MSFRQRSRSGAHEESSIAIGPPAGAHSRAGIRTKRVRTDGVRIESVRTESVPASRVPAGRVPPDRDASTRPSPATPPAGRPPAQYSASERFAPTSPPAASCANRQPAPAALSNPDYRSLLLAKKQEVLTGMGMKFDAASKLGRVAEDDAVQIAHDEFINLRLNAIGWDQIRLMDEALDRLQTGDFGACMRCEEPISPKRLAVVPWAKYCVKCQEKLAARDSFQEEIEEAFPNHSFR